MPPRPTPCPGYEQMPAQQGGQPLALIARGDDEGAGHRGGRETAGAADAAVSVPSEVAELSRLAQASASTAALRFAPSQLSPEFVKESESKPGRVHCEVWTKAEPQPPPSLCAVVCRLEPECQGFTVDPDFKWCLWYDRIGWPQSSLTPDGEPCSSVTKALYLKKEKGPYDFKTWSAIKKVKVLEKRLGTMLGFEILHPFKINGSQVLWNPYDPHFEEILELEGGGYQWAQSDVAELRSALVNASDDAYELANEQPSLKEAELAAHPTSTVQPTLEPTEEEEEDTWETKWSKEYPDCPMGAPCFCDCRCRDPASAPVDPAASAFPTPCPPPPTPNPGLVGTPQDAQALR